MSAVAVASIAFALILAGIGLGVWLRRSLPETHLGGDSKDVIKLATALVATMSALVIALLFASTRASFEATNSQVGQLTASVIELDRLLEEYGEEGLALRRVLRQDVATMIASIWTDDGAVAPTQAATADIQIIGKLHQLAAHDSRQGLLQARVATVSGALSHIRLGLYAHPADSISKPFMSVLVLWLCFIFCTFALSANANATLLSVLFFSALSAASAIYLILELGQPFDGLMQVSSDSLRTALAPL